MSIKPKPLANVDLVDKFIGEAPIKDTFKPWENKEPSAKRTGVKAHHINLNEYEKLVIDAAAAASSQSATAFMRQIAMVKSKEILDIT